MNPLLLFVVSLIAEIVVGVAAGVSCYLIEGWDE